MVISGSVEGFIRFVRCITHQHKMGNVHHNANVEYDKAYDDFHLNAKVDYDKAMFDYDKAEADLKKAEATDKPRASADLDKARTNFDNAKADFDAKYQVYLKHSDALTMLTRVKSNVPSRQPRKQMSGLQK